MTEKRTIFGAIYAALRPSGVFVNADATLPTDPSACQAEYEAWAAHLVSCGIAEERAWSHFEEWADEDTYFSMEDELAALTDVGFDAACLWRVAPVTVIKAAKSNTPSA